jgi:hypothetical protein
VNPPIIDKETFAIVEQRRSKTRIKRTRAGVVHPMSGMVFCADCGETMYLGKYHKKGGVAPEFFSCSTYRRGRGCSTHTISVNALNKIVLDNLRQVTRYAREHKSEFLETVYRTSEKVTREKEKKELSDLQKAKNRSRTLDMLIQRLYEDNVAGKISDERFRKMTDAYEQEQAELETQIAELEDSTRKAEAQAVNTEYFLKLVDKYTDITELTTQILREFIQKIVVHQKERLYDRTVQRVTIIYNFIGEIKPLALKRKGA